MKKHILFFVTFSLIIPTICNAQKIPSSVRSRNAITNVTPRLENEFTDSNLVLGKPVYIRIFKEENELELWVEDSSGFKLFKTYAICDYGSEGIGPKVMQGDGKAPEGFYFVKPNQLNPYSSFHLSFNLGYPNAYDRAHKRTGSALMVHGNCVSIGCYAMTNDGIEEIYAIVDASLRNGQPFFRVHIFPFKMTDINMQRYKDSKWYPFWQNVKEGYDFFDNNNCVPPNVIVENDRYVFNAQ